MATTYRLTDIYELKDRLTHAGVNMTVEPGSTVNEELVLIWDASDDPDEYDDRDERVNKAVYVILTRDMPEDFRAAGRKILEVVSEIAGVA